MARKRRKIDKRQNNSIHKIDHNVYNMYCIEFFKKLKIVVPIKSNCRYGLVGLHKFWEFGQSVT